nr:hypothetical protein [uncultured Lacibacter sp.]
MKHFLPFIILVITIASCRGSRSATYNDERDLSSLINRLNKKGADDKIIADLQQVYNNAYTSSIQRLNNYSYDPAPNKWEKIIPELEGLHRMYETISQSAYALRLLKPDNVYPRLISTKDSAAADYYQFGSEQMNLQTRENYKEAYYAFQRSQQYVPNYRDAKQLQKEVFDRSIVNVLINQIQYDQIGMGNNWGWNPYSNRDRQYQLNIIRDLGGQNSTTNPARFFDEMQLRTMGAGPDLVVDLVWRNLRFDQPRDQTRSYNRSKQIETGKDTSGKPVYTTVNATVHVTKRMLNGDADMNIIVTDAVSRSQVKWEQVPSEYRYVFEFATFTGDRRALDNNDITLINRSDNQRIPTKEEAMAEMMQRIHSNIVSRIRNTVSW